MSETGKLIVCATPIGNLSDMTPRAVKSLKQADLIAAEDTRNTRKLLERFKIETPMTSYHHYNRVDKAKELIEEIMSGKTVALVTDAGTPAVSDPGEELVNMCHERGITVTGVPGPSAAILALSMSGLKSGKFTFIGFLPRDNKERKAALAELAEEKHTLILYEAPHRMAKTLNDLHTVLGDRSICVAHELTKVHESIHRGTIGELSIYFSKNEPKGEYVLIIEEPDAEALKQESVQKWNSIPVGEHVLQYEEAGHDRKTAMKLAAKDRGVSKRDIYKKMLEEIDENVDI